MGHCGHCSDKMCSTGEGNDTPLKYSCLENRMNSMKGQKDRTLKDELPGLVGAQYTTGEQWRNNSRKNEEMEPEQKQYPVVDGTGDRSEIRYMIIRLFNNILFSGQHFSDCAE